MKCPDCGEEMVQTRNGLLCKKCFRLIPDWELSELTNKDGSK